ncbi:MAG: hypothetical protein ACLR2E_21605 [Lachnospiraceae bacterium]
MLLIYIAGFVGVSQDYIEAAEIDGATAGQITRHIRLAVDGTVLCNLFLSDSDICVQSI